MAGVELGQSREFVYKPIPVKTLLTELRDISNLMIDLAYYSVLQGDEGLAKEVFKLEERVDYLETLLMIQASLATKGIVAAEQMVSVLKLAIAANKISDAAADIAKITLSKIKLSPEIAKELFGGEEIISHIKVEGGSWLDGTSLYKALKLMNIIVDVVTVRRGSRWILEPGEDFKLRSGDIVIVKGSREAFRKMSSIIGDESMRIDKLPYTNIGLKLLELKNTAEVMIDLAYTALLTKSEDIAKHVLQLEDHVDRLLDEFELLVSKSNAFKLSEKIGLLRIGVASENIADAAAEIAETIARGLEPHPVIVNAINEGIERISVVEMDEEDEGNTLHQLGYSEKGVTVLAIKRDDKWYILPSDDFKVLNGDILLVKYYSESERFIEELERKEDREEIIEEIQEEEWEED